MTSEENPAPASHDQRMADAVARLEGLAHRPPEEHVEVYEDVHRVLHASLSDAQAGPDPDPGPGSDRDPDPDRETDPDQHEEDPTP